MSLTVKRCSKNWLALALEKTLEVECQNNILTLKNFIDVTHFKIDKWSMDKFFHNIQDDIPVYIDNSIIEWIGYNGPLKLQRQKVRKLLKNNFAEYENELWFELSNKEYAKYFNENPMYPEIYPNPAEFKGKNKTKHMIVHPNIFKYVIMLSSTTKKMQVLSYYIGIEDLLKKFHQYQCKVYNLDVYNECKGITNLKHIKKYSLLCSIRQLELNLSDKYRIGCVYFIQEAMTKNIKIGWCWHLPTRLSALQTGNSQELTVVRKILCKFPHTREQELHKKYKQYHIRGEWFQNMIN